MANLFQNGTPFADGSVTKIRFTNFLSMAEAELNFGPKLNLIIGPNGSGKSTVICGLCLALGGSPKLLGRSEVMSDYVRHGCEKGAVEVNIRDSKESHDRKVELIITKNNHVEYRRDGRKVTRAEVRSMAMSYGIQVDNPCVFLAQDKVKSFAQQTPELLLDNTEKACSNDLEKMHDKLRVFSKADCRKSSQKQCLEKRLSTIENELETIKPRVQNYLQRQAMQTRLELLQKKEAFIMCEKEERSAARMEEAVKTSEEKLEEAREKLEEVEAEQERTSEEMERRNRQFLDLSDEYRSIYSELDGLAKADYISEAVRQANAKYHETMKNFEAWKEEMEKAEALLEEYRAKQADQSANSSLESEKVALKREYEKWLKKEDELDQKTNKINAGFSQLRIEKESIDRVDLSGRQQFAEKLEIVRATNPRQRCADAFAWYEAHKEQFRKPVYVPVLSMTMNYEDSAPYLETVIPSRDLMVFIFGCREDEQLLADSKHPWRISSTVVSDEQVAKLSVDQPLPESMRVLGFERTAFQLFTAPPVVKAFLNSVAHLSNIPIGTEKTKENLDEVCAVLKNTHRLFLAADLKVRLTKSLYRADISVQTDCLRRNLRYLTAHMPSHTGGDKLDEASVKQALCSIEQRSQKLRAELEEVKRVQQMVATQKEKVRCQLAKIYQKDKAHGSIGQLLKLAQRKRDRLEQDKPDLKAAAEARRKAKSDAIQKGVADFNRLLELLERLRGVNDQLVFAKHEQKKKKLDVAALGDRVEELNEAFNMAKEELDEQRIGVEQATRKANECRLRLMTVAKIGSTYRENLSGEQHMVLKMLKMEWSSNSIPNDIEKVREEITEETARMNIAPADGCRSDLEQHDRLLTEQSKLNDQLQLTLREVEDSRKEMDELLQRWLDGLDELLAKINERYARFFQQVKCTGEVRLQKPEEKFDVEHYGVTILVKFREGESLRQLTHRTQSGGERSVATMLYVMALQELCRVPFRCVDEINQGMDPNNERLVFEILVSLLSDTSCHLSTTQYFMLTPKLLQGLHYGDDTKTHIICDACTNAISSQISISFIRQQLQLAAETERDEITE